MRGGERELRRFGNEDGQSFVEFALIMPFLIFLLLAIVQFGRAWHNYIAITDAARVGAREGAVNRVSGACAAATTRINSLGVVPAGSSVACTAGTSVGQDIVITISYEFDIGLPGFFGVPALSQTLTLESVAKERLE
jgi:Flp pilus assembly protein TadG